MGEERRDVTALPAGAGSGGQEQAAPRAPRPLPALVSCWFNVVPRCTSRAGTGGALRLVPSRLPPPFLKHDPNLSWGEKKYIKGGNHGVQRCARRVPRTAWPCSCREEERRARAGGGPGGVSEGRRTAALPAAAGAAALGAGPAGAAPPALPSRCPPAPALRAGLCCTARHRFCDGADSLCSPPWLPCPSRRLGAA